MTMPPSHRWTRRGLLGAAAALLSACSRRGSQTETPSPSAPPATSSGTATPSQSSSSARATPTPSPTPTATASIADVLRPGVVNVLFLGNDSRTDNWSGRPDVIMVAQLSADRTKLAVVSIPRDTFVSYAGGGSGKINAAQTRGGTAGMVKTVSALFGGLQIHYVAQTGFAGFIAITRWLKGITVTNRHATTAKVISTGRVVFFKKGRITLEGTDGLIYARERKTLPLGDLDRAERHRALLQGMISRLKQHAATEPTQLPMLLRMLLKNTKVSGGISEQNVLGLLPALRRVDERTMISLQVPIQGFAMVNGASVNRVNAARMRALGEAMRTADPAAYVKQYGQGYAPGA
ncbi:LCP family protein [Aestuariimicrobium kwangyangense]|uniref:LCP family protein n=1 Tax=Aestuariimicrobium kwangyangense TaxID=396389 RepID=UPI000407351C|nr:LCP family protein [Aestuariimicrobium kwangyangense]